MILLQTRKYFTLHETSQGCVTCSENNSSFVGWPPLVSLAENPQNGVEWLLSVSLSEMEQRNVALFLACSLRLLPSAPVLTFSVSLPDWTHSCGRYDVFRRSWTAVLIFDTTVKNGLLSLVYNPVVKMSALKLYCEFRHTGRGLKQYAAKIAVLLNF